LTFGDQLVGGLDRRGHGLLSRNSSHSVSSLSRVTASSNSVWAISATIARRAAGGGAKARNDLPRMASINSSSTGWTDKTSPECRRATCRSASSSSAGSELTSPVANEVEASTCSSRRDSSDAGGSPSTCRAGRRSGSRPPCEPDADAMRVISGVLARVAKQQHDQRQQRGVESEAGVGDPPKPDVLAHDGGRPFQLFLLLEQALEDALHERLGRLG